MATLEIAAALGGPWEQLGALIKDAGQEDASGYRRYLATKLARRECETVARMLCIPVEDAEALRGGFVCAFGGPVED